MKIIKKSSMYLTIILLALFASVVTLAQEGDGADINVNINEKGGDDWYTSPWVWIIGAIVFILLLVALLRGGGRRD